MKPKHQRNIRPILNGPEEESTFLAAGLGEMGLTTFAISRETGLSESQVMYRLRVLKVKRADFRNGSSITFKRMWKEHGRFVTKLIEPRAEKVRYY